MRQLTFALAFCALGSSAWAGQVIDTPIMASAENFRDMAGISAAFGGTGRPDAAGRGTLRPGVVYRANALTLSPADQITLVRLGIAEVIDLRTPAEIKRQPDILPPGVTYVNVNIIGAQVLPPPDTSSPEAATRQMETYYRKFVTSPAERGAIRVALLDIANAEKPVVFHCSAGKDRSGWLAAILQSIAGVKQDDIMRDYLASNRYEAPGIQAMLARLPASRRPGFAVLLGVQPRFLAEADGAVARDYGGMHRYLTVGLGLTPAEIAQLRQKLVAE